MSTDRPTLRHPPHRHKHARLVNIVQDAFDDVCGLPRPGLFLCIDEVEPFGRPIEKVRVWSTLHFTAQDSPFCCGESGCHLPLHEEGLAVVAKLIQKALSSRHPLEVDIGGRIRVLYHEGVQFDSHRGFERMSK